MIFASDASTDVFEKNINMRDITIMVTFELLLIIFRYYISIDELYHEELKNLWGNELIYENNDWE